MTLATREAERFTDTGHHPFTTAVLVVLFWLAAAALVATAHVLLDPFSTYGSSVVTTVAIAVVAYAYTRFCARHAELPHALGVGVAWLVLAIAAEILMTARTGRGWYGLIGSPDRPLLRNIDFFVWIFAPALFARREMEA